MKGKVWRVGLHGRDLPNAEYRLSDGSIKGNPCLIVNFGIQNVDCGIKFEGAYYRHKGLAWWITFCKGIAIAAGSFYNYFFIRLLVVLDSCLFALNPESSPK